MPRTLWNSLKTTVLLWRWALPGMVVIGLVMAARLTGSLQSLELLALDLFLRHRPAEPADDRIVLVGIDEADLQKAGYPIPEQALIALLTRLQTYKPTVIGLHILQNQMAKSERTTLFTALNQRQNLIVSEKVLSAADQIPPPLGFPPDQVGLIDLLPDGDNRANNHVRRTMLGIYDPLNAEAYKYSLTIQLVKTYLSAQDPQLTLQNGLRDQQAMRFGSVELPRLQPSGAYAGVETGGPQILLNFRQQQQPFRVLSLREVQTGVEPNWLRDRIVIVGITDPKIRPIIPTAAIAPTNSLDIQAHAVSQIISAVLDKRLLLHTWTDGWEYLWILGWGCVGVYLDRRSRSWRQTLLAVGTTNLLLLGVSYTLLLLQGLWLPVLPALIVLNLSVIFPAVYSYVYEHEQSLKTRLDERQRTIEQTFNTLHNGPLQTLANLLRQWRDNKVPQAQLLSTLENLNAEIRGVGEHLKQEALTQAESLYLKSGLKLDLKLPVHDLFYEVYSHTLERSDFSRFATLKTSCYFEPIEQRPLSIDQTRDLCRFIEEALCNVGKHAETATHLEVTGTNRDNWYRLCVADNGIGTTTVTAGEGTKHARKLASRLGGTFKREPVSPQGTLCELAFPLTKASVLSRIF